jgi:AcrR family transcriptional regulator
VLSRVRTRRRILDAAFGLAAQGGYDALQVRAIAQRAGVSSRTIYENFASLDSLLIIAVAERSDVLDWRQIQSFPDGPTPAARVNELIDELTATVTANRTVTVALCRALLSGKPDVAQHVRGFREATRAALAAAITAEPPTRTDREVAEILESTWFTALAGWATGTAGDTDISEIMRSATRLLLPDG